ncbi:unnamed protein product [Prorocentrum cordatum]|uniref:Uncharacterized protein n=1 Tax=Prorocentrum cordatum TaxID=2364126 RepID=A0ABN9UZS0_9DINO|nr:unnamed protein product [Polarella glacialis]
MQFQDACAAMAGDTADDCAGLAVSTLKVVASSEVSTAPLSFAEPLVEHSDSFTGETPINLSPELVCLLGGEFSFMCTARMDGVGPWSRIFDFSLEADEDSITAGRTDGMAPLRVDRPRMMVGGHYLFKNQYFRGSLKDVKVWNQEVPWEARSASRVVVHALGTVFSEPVETSPSSELDGKLRGALDAVDPTSEDAKA